MLGKLFGCKKSEKSVKQISFVDEIVNKAITLNAKSRKVIVFAETDATILKACSIILEKNIAMPLIVGQKNEISQILEKEKITNIKDEHIVDYLDPKNSAKLDEYAQEYLKIRLAAGKTLILDDAKKLISEPHYYAAMMLNSGLADGMISGINSATKPYLPAFQIIKTEFNVPKASGLMIMEHDDLVYFFADIALNINPTANELATIAISTAKTAKELGKEPKVAMISFSTKDSAKHEMVDKVKEATRIAKEKSPGLIIDGELQIDAAIVPEVAAKKCPNSELAGFANVLIFSDLNVGNSAYKLVQRLAGYKAIGPIMQGLNKPVNDLSRGASVNDVVELCAITVLQVK